MSTKLLNCPFCNCIAIADCIKDSSFNHVECDGCGARSPYDSTASGAVAAWNTRAALSTPADHVADVVAVYDKLHAGKIGAHWLWCVIEQIAAGVPETEAMRGYGYYEPSKWVSVADQLPKSEEAVLITGVTWDGLKRGRFCAVAITNGDRTFYDQDTADEYVSPTHWQPLPAGPVEQGEQG